MYSDIVSIDKKSKPQTSIWYSDIYELEQQQKQLNTEKNKEELFSKEYSNIPFKRLQKQKENVRTDDGAVHYFDKETQTIFSYNFGQKFWYSCKENDIGYKSYLKLFN